MGGTPCYGPFSQAVGSTCGPASLMSFTLNGDEVRQWLIELSMSPSCGLEMSLINILIFLFCLPPWSGKNLRLKRQFSPQFKVHLHMEFGKKGKAQVD